MPEPLSGVCRVMRMIDGVNQPVRIDRADYDGAKHILFGEDAPRGAGAIPPTDDEPRFTPPVVAIPAPRVPNEQLSKPTVIGAGTAKGPAPDATVQAPPATAPTPIDKSVPRTVTKDIDGKWYLFALGQKTHPNGYDNRADIVTVADAIGFTLTNRDEASK